MKNRITAVILLIAMMTSALVFAACGEDAGSVKPADTAAAQGGEGEEEETTLSEAEARLALPDNLPEADYQGYTFRIAGRTRDDFVQEIGAELEETGDVIEDSIYHRNHDVMERFNVDIKGVYFDTPQNNVQKSVQAGDDEFDLLLGQVIEVGSTVTNGNYLNWYEMPHINLDQPWYIGNAKDALSIGDKAYMMAGEYCLSILRFSYCMYFNKKLVENYSVDNPYATVQDGKWTLDKLSDTIKDVYIDLNGDSVRDGGGDQFGLVSDYYSATITYQYAFDNPVMTKTADGVPEVNFNTPKTATMVQRLNDFAWGNPGALFGGWDVYGSIWKDGRTMYLNSMFMSALNYRDMETDFGIIPYPKYDEAQDAYHSMSDGAHTIMAIPKTVSDLERNSVILEALNAESYKQVIPAYYEIALKVKYSRDEESVAVLDMLLDGRYFDFGYVYDGWKGYAFILQDLISSKKADFASAYAKKEKSATKQYGGIIDMYLGLEG
ncbi:MAG: hypothetical protein K6D94_06745 [Clostridiales bacterium]|nr:hypothetical protein [Clostridiales bacterium]